MPWCCAACEPCRGSGDCHGRFERGFHKELIHNCMEPCVGSWSVLIKSGRRPHSGQHRRCRSERRYETGTFSWRVIVRPTRRGAWIGRTYSCISRHNCCKTITPGNSGQGFRKETFAHFSSPSLLLVFLTGYVLDTQRLGTFVLLACFPLVKSKCFLDSGVRRCCKVGHSCLRSVIGCSSVPHKMAWRSVARATGTVPRLGRPGCEIFDISQLRFELDSTFQELDTPPSRCCWRCAGCHVRR